MNYFKNLRQLFQLITRQYVYEDPNFPSAFDGSPCPQTITKIKLLDQKLGLLYKGTTKKLPGELFKRKVREETELPEFSEVSNVLAKIWEGLDQHLETLESHFGSEGSVDISSNSGSSIDKKKVSGNVYIIQTSP